MPKVRGCIQAIRAGVGEVSILDGRVEHALLLEMLNQRVGTTIAADPVQKRGCLFPLFWLKQRPRLWRGRRLFNFKVQLAGGGPPAGPVTLALLFTGSRQDHVFQLEGSSWPGCTDRPAGPSLPVNGTSRYATGGASFLSRRKSIPYTCRALSRKVIWHSFGR